MNQTNYSFDKDEYLKFIEQESATHYNGLTLDKMVTISGTVVSPVQNPQPEQIKVVDIAHSLSRICRFNGHVENHYSVVRHAILTCRIVQWLGGNKLEQLWALHHDDTEAYLSDIPKPAKVHMQEYKEIEEKLNVVIHEGLGIPLPNSEQYKIVKKADVIMLNNEALSLTKHNDWADPRYKIPFLFGENLHYSMDYNRDYFISIHEQLMKDCKELGFIQ